MADDRKEKYINPYTDFGFKKLFGTEMNKDLLISFLNALFHDEQVVKDVKYLNSEKLGEGYGDRKAIFDVYCENEESVKIYRDLKNSIETAVWKDKVRTAREMKADGVPTATIVKYTKLPIEEIEAL